MGKQVLAKLWEAAEAWGERLDALQGTTHELVIRRYRQPARVPVSASDHLEPQAMPAEEDSSYDSHFRGIRCMPLHSHTLASK